MSIIRGRTKRPQVLVFDDYRRISRHVTLKIANRIKSNRADDDERRRTVLGLATGSSPLGVYRELAKMYKDGSIDFSDCVFFNLDEYYEISPKDLQSYHRFMRENFFDYIDAREDQINVPDGTITVDENIRAYTQEYEAKIRGLGGIDIQILGLGRNGHIGFNEPGSSFDSRTRIVDLAETTRKDAAPEFFGLRNVPTKAITMGVGTILEARELVLLVSGEHKSKILQRSLEAAPNQEVPASFIQFHGDVEVLSDPVAASLLIEYSAPWLVRNNIDWMKERMLSYSAIIWLAQRKRKPLSNLQEEDFRMEHLRSLYLARGSGFASDAVKEFESKVGVLPSLINERRLKKEATTRPPTILVFSPHPDDDVICMGATMRKLSDGGSDLHAAYMVSGANAVKDLDVLSYLDLENRKVLDMVSEYAGLGGKDLASARREIIRSIYSKPKGSPDKEIVRMIKAEIRHQEAVRAASVARVKQTHFLNLPFYEEYGSARKAPISTQDIEIVRNLLFKVRPDSIFIAGDTTDPNGTHAMCLDAFQGAFSSLGDYASTDEEKDYAAQRDRVTLFHYRGAWQEFRLEESDAIEPFGEIEMERKIEMILEHVSQIDPLFPGPDDDRQFWERARDRNRNFVDLCKRLGVGVDGIGAEVYRFAEIQ